MLRHAARRARRLWADAWAGPLLLLLPLTLVLLLLLPQPLWLRPTCRIRTDSPLRAPPVRPQGGIRVRDARREMGAGERRQAWRAGVLRRASPTLRGSVKISKPLQTKGGCRERRAAWALYDGVRLPGRAHPSPRALSG